MRWTKKKTDYLVSRLRASQGTIHYQVTIERKAFGVTYL